MQTSYHILIISTGHVRLPIVLESRLYLVICQGTNLLLIFITY